MKTKDIPDEPILRFLAKHQGEWCNWFSPVWIDGTLNKQSVVVAFPPNTPDKLIISKMNSLIRRGLSGGCGCGCRGDFEITDKGLEVIGEKRTKPYTGY